MRFRPLPPAEQTPEQRAVADAILTGPRGNRPGITLRDAEGALRPPFDAMLRNPSVGMPLQAVGAALRFATALRADLREFVILLVAVHWRCEHEWFEHEPLARSAGVPEHVLASLSFAAACDDIDDDYAAVEKYVRELFPRAAVADATYERLVARLGEAQAFEVTVIAGYYSTLAMILNALCPFDGGPADGVTAPHWAKRPSPTAAA